MNNKFALRAPCCALILSAGLLAACARTPVPELPVTDIPANWQGPLEPTAALWPNTDWWNNFDSEELTEIIELVKANNFDYANNLRNLQAAELSLREADLALLPTPNVSISTGASTSTSQIANGPTIDSGSSGPFRLNAGASYSNILGIPLRHEQALNQYESQRAQISNTALRTLQTAAQAYFQLLFLRDQIEVTRLNLDNAREILGFTQARVDAGVEIPINLISQQINVQNTELSLESQIQQDFQRRAALALLTGRGVQGFDVEGQTLEGITVPEVRPGLPSELLTRRPDLVQAEINLRNAAISVDQARLSFLPSISLSGSAGSSSPALIDIISDPAQSSFSLSANLAQTLLDNGGRRRSVERARLNLESQLASYRQTVISVFNDIDVQLQNIGLTRQQGEVILQQRDQAEEQFRLAQLRYEQGVTNFQTVIQAQNQLFSARQSVLNNRLQQINAILTFYVALGGGWESGELLVEQPEYAANSTN